MHIPVLLKEVINGLDPKPNQNYIDGTLGEGGHSLEILKLILPNGKILGIDFDQRNIEFAEKKFINSNIPKENFILVSSNFKNIKEIAKENKIEKVDGILFDLGLNSYFIDESGQGFTFQNNEPLDMRFDKNLKITAKDVLNKYSKEEINKILREYGDELFSKQIAQNIINYRKKEPINTTFDLNKIIWNSTPSWYKKKKINPSTKTFMALRIYVNQEFENLKKALKDSVELLKSGGKIAVISFHSLEDVIVKNYFKQLISEKTFIAYNKKVIAPKWEEIKNNKRSRSAKLRIIIKK